MNGKDLPGFPPLASLDHHNHIVVIVLLIELCTKPSDDLNQGHKPWEASPKETQDLFHLLTSMMTAVKCCKALWHADVRFCLRMFADSLSMLVEFG